MTPYLFYRRRLLGRLPAWAALCAVLWAPGSARASFLQGEALDNVADAMSWLVLVLVPVVGITVFWLVHILPEKIAEKKKHPQTHAIQCLCLMSLVFGGLLWPLAWLWAYSKPVFYKMAYGTDVDETIGHGKKEKTKVADGPQVKVKITAESKEVEQLRARIAQLESQVKTEGGTV